MNKVTSRVKEHDCRINWGGSSKEMEIDLAINILVSGTTEKARISAIIIAAFRNNSKNKKSSATWDNKRDWNISWRKICRKWYIFLTEKSSQFLIQKFCLLSKMFFIRKQAAQEWSSTHKSRYSKYSSILLWRPWKMCFVNGVSENSSKL